MMMDQSGVHIAIVDYGMGNLFSIANACARVGLTARPTAVKHDLLLADAVILPGVGAFGTAMARLKELDLVGVIKDAALSKPVLGICLGMQLLLDASEEFGTHQGLGIIPGQVVRLTDMIAGSESRVKVPQVGWNRIYHPDESAPARWPNVLLTGIANGSYMYFVHSYYAVPEDPTRIVSLTTYGDTTFCSTIQDGNILACQFHPERSGPAGLKIYENLARLLLRADKDLPGLPH